MKILKRILIGLVILIIVIAAGLYFFLQTTKPVYDGEVTLSGTRQLVEVLYDAYGIPHIYAQNQPDAYFALGYVHAQDRLFQMEMLRRAAAGRLSEILGPDLLTVDKLFRTLRINEFAEAQASKFLSADTSAFQQAALAYQKGINAYIKEGKTPLEFSIIGIEKTPFTPKDIYLAVGFMSFGFAEGLRVDPVLQQIQTQWGNAYLKDLAVNSPGNTVRIPSHAGDIKTQAQLISAFHKALTVIPIPQLVGSNGWAIAGSKTQSGKPILSNDTHIGYGQPAVWYEAYLEYPGFSFYGHHLAGIPFGLLGQNNFCGWGITMFENDDTDFYIETTDADHTNQVKRREGWEPIRIIQESIKIKGQPDVLFNVRTTSHGPIVNGIVQSIDSADNWIALDWQLLHGDNFALQAAYDLNHATTFAEANQAVSLFSAPGLNIMYADRAGNIAWWAAAKLPKRKNPHSKFFYDASTGDDDYDGYYTFAQNPQSVNPPNGFVYSANNQPDTVGGVYYPGYYYPRDRASRIVKLLSDEKTWTVQESQRVILDVTSDEAVKLAKEMSTVLEKNLTPAYQPMITILNQWDGGMEENDLAPSVYYNLLSQIIYLAMRDELGTETLESISSVSIMKNSYALLLNNDSSVWWDNVKTSNIKETRTDIFEQAAKNTLANLTKTCGADPAQWMWGKIHTLKHNHPLGAVKLFDGFFSVGPLAVPGGNEVINNLHFDLDTTGYFAVNGGPALRKTTDFIDLSNGETASPTGQSGNVMSLFYADQAEMFATGQFRKMLTKREDVEKVLTGKLVIKSKD
jgi:penicillin G amidase